MDWDDNALLRYSRHLLLPQIDVAGQRRIAAGRVLVVGAGGLGSPAALYLAGAGVGRMTIADGDRVELSNLQRQVAYDMASLGLFKAEATRARMLALNPDIHVSALCRRLDGEDLAALVAEHDLVLDCSDNPYTRHDVNRATVAARVPLISGAALRFDGQLAVFDSRQADSPCYHCLFPGVEPTTAEACAALGVFSPLVGVIGSLQAVEAVKLLAGRDFAWGRLTLFDALSLDFRQFSIPRDPNCPVCAGRGG